MSSHGPDARVCVCVCVSTLDVRLCVCVFFFFSTLDVRLPGLKERFTGLGERARRHSSLTSRATLWCGGRHTLSPAGE